MSDLPTLQDIQAGQEALFAGPLPKAVHAFCHNCAATVSEGDHRCVECGAVQQVKTKRERVERETTTVMLVDAGRPGDPPMNVRLKRAMKALYRTYNLRIIPMKG